MGMATTVMQRLFLKVTPTKGHILEEPLKSNDLVRMCFMLKLIDSGEKTGIAHSKVPLLFIQVIKHMPKRLFEREKKRNQNRGRKMRERKHHHHRIVGRTQLSILMEELYDHLPGGLFSG